MGVVFDEVEGTVDSPSQQPDQAQQAASAQAGQQGMNVEQFYVLHEQELRRYKRLRAD